MQGRFLAHDCSPKTMKAIIKSHVSLILSVILISSPILDVLTAWTVSAGFPLSVGVVCRTLYMASAFFYVVFVAAFRSKKWCLVALGILCGYILVFMAHLFMIGGIPLCLHNIRETSKTFYTPIIALLLYAVYSECDYSLSTKAIAITGGLYTSIVLIAYLTGTSYITYADSGYGYCGWFFAANEVGCVVSITAPITIYYCMTILPTATVWWKKILICWTLFSIIFSANFIGTKVVFIFIVTYCTASFFWMSFSTQCENYMRWHKYRNQATLILGVMLVIVVGMYVASPLSEYLVNVYTELMKEDSMLRAISTNLEIEADSNGTWLRTMLENNRFLAKVDQILSRRLMAASPSIQAYIDGDIGIKLFGIGYATASAYGRSVDYMIEMDLIAILIRHGIIGFTIYAIPYLIFISWSITYFCANIKKCLCSYRYCTYLYSTLAAFAISAVAGHALVSPAVATFSIAISMNLWIAVKENNADYPESFQSEDSASCFFMRKSCLSFNNLQSDR